MTVLDMHQAFKIEFDKLDSVNYPNILPEEIDYLLNKAQDRFVKQRYGKNNIKRESFEEIQKRTEKRKIEILQYDLEMNFIKEWDSATDVKNELGLNNSSITNCCKNVSKPSYRYIWKYK